jgi:hypothetical protein
MPISIFAKKPNAKPGHKDVVVRWTCDGFHGFRDPPVQEFRTIGNRFAHSFAMEAGWKESFVHGERRFFCPRCSGKVKQATGD